MTTFKYTKLENARNFIYGAEMPAKWGIVFQAGFYLVTTNRHLSNLLKAGAQEVSLF